MWPFSDPYPIGTLADIASKKYDFIVAGGGTAGCVLASRLSEDRNVTVLLLERGPVLSTWASRVPLISSDFRPATAPVYKWAAEKLTSAGLGDLAVNMVGGRVLGGTSKVNGHLYTRSMPSEYNAWAQSGRVGWGWDDVAPWFSKSERSLTHGQQDHRGSDGPWTNQRLQEVYFQNTQEAIKAAAELGIPALEAANDPNAPPVSSVRADHTIDENSRRQSLFDAFLPPHVWKRPNLTICTNAVVDSIYFEEHVDGPRATGVRVVHEDPSNSIGVVNVSVRHEVVLAGGAIASPQILMLSGVGPAEHLQTHGVQVVKNLPGVGSHLQDHVASPVIYKVPLHDTVYALETSVWLQMRELARYILFGTGLFLSPVPQSIIFADSSLLDEEARTIVSPKQLDARLDPYDPANLPDIEIMLIPYTAFVEHANIGLSPSEGPAAHLCAVLRPESVGTVRLTSRDPRARPACDLNYFSAPGDYAKLRSAIKLSLAISRQMRAQGYPMRDGIVPEGKDDSDLDKFIRKNSHTTYHYSSTCRMAPEAEAGVVDDMLRVHGIKGLRVADASIFPTIPACHLQAPTVMVAERCADFMLRARKERV